MSALVAAQPSPGTALMGRTQPLDPPGRAVRSTNGALPPPAAGRKTLLEHPVFGVERPLSNTRGIRGSCSRKIPIERRRRDTKALRDLSDGDVGIGEQRLGGFDVILGEFRWTTSGAAKSPGGGQTRLSALPDQAALEFRQRPKHMKNQP